MIQESQVREELAARIAARLSLTSQEVTRMLSRDSILGDIWGDYLLCRETIDRFRTAQSTGGARVAEYESHAASLEEELMRRVQEIR